MKRRLHDLRGFWVALLGLAVVSSGGCASSGRMRAYEPFPQTALDGISRGMPAQEVRQLFGIPHDAFEVSGGQRTQEPWEGLAYVYYMDEDPRFGSFDRRLKNWFVFEVSATDTLLNYWELEQGRDRYFESTERTLESTVRNF